MIRIALIGVAAALPAVATAQRPAEPKPSIPVAAPASASLPRYESAFDGYRAWRDEPLEPWREVNDRVGRVGGHAGIFKAEEQAAPGAGTAPSPQPAPATGGHRHGH